MAQLESDDFVACYQLHYRRLVRALELAGADRALAEDLAQDAFARMLAHWRRVRSGANPAGYAYRSAFRLLSRDRKRRWATSSEDQTNVGEQRGTAEAEVTTRLAVVAALAAMPPRRRACAVMCLVVGLPTSEAAAALGIAEGTVRKHLADARADLVEFLRA